MHPFEKVNKTKIIMPTTIATMLDESVGNCYKKTHVEYDLSVQLERSSKHYHCSAACLDFPCGKMIFFLRLKKKLFNNFCGSICGKSIRKNYVKPNEIDTQMEREKEIGTVIRPDNSRIAIDRFAKYSILLF